MNNDYNETTPSRVRKNANLYRRIDAANIDDIEPRREEEVIESNTTTIDVEKLKSMLDKKYREPGSNTVKDIDHKPVNRDINLEETREYNLDEILNKAKDSEDTDYGVERLKKLSDTNVSILDGLNIKDNSSNDASFDSKVNDVDSNDNYSGKSKVSSDSKKLIELIDTINLKEQEGYDALLKETNYNEDKVYDSDQKNNDLLDDLNLEDTGSNEPLDMLSELTGSDEDTKVVGAKRQEKDFDDLEKVSSNNKDAKNDKYDDIDLDDTEDDFDTTEVVSRDDTDEFTDSIELTTTQIFTKDDFEDFDDLKEATKPRIFVKILIFLIVVAVIVGTVFVLDRVLDLGILSKLGINF